MFNIAALLVGQDEWRSVPLVTGVILCRCERRAVAYMGQQPETKGFHSYMLTQLWFTQRMCSLYSSAFRVGFWNRSSLKQRIPTIRNLAILRNCVLLTDREEERNTESKKLKNRKNVFGFYFGAGVHNSKMSGRSGDYKLHGGTKYLCVFGVELAACTFLEPTVLTSLLYFRKICASLF
jgi:hypothetical protein